MTRKMFLNGISKPYLTVLKVNKPYSAPVTWETSDIPGRAGVRPKKKKREAEVLSVDVLIEGATEDAYDRNIEDLVAWLDSDEPMKLEFENEPNRYRMALYQGSLDPAEFATFGKVTIEFLVPDSYKYGKTLYSNFTSGAAAYVNNGTADALPVFELDVTGDITHVSINKGEEYMQIGEPPAIVTPVYKRETLILNDPLTTTTGWTVGSDVDNGYITGSIAPTASGWTVNSYGTNQTPKEWQGPVMRKGIPEALQNFKVDLDIQLLNTGGRMGMIEVYLLDSANQTVAKIGFEDVWESITRNQAKFQLGGVGLTRKVDLRRTADAPWAWNDFKGIIRLWRDGNRFRPYFGIKQSNGKHVWVSQNYLYTDKDNLFSNKITQVQIALRRWPGVTEAQLKVSNLKIYRLNDPVSNAIPYIAGAGDKIIIDHEANSILINGEERKDLKDFGAQFFTLPKGTDGIFVYPADKLTGKVTYKERFK